MHSMICIINIIYQIDYISELSSIRKFHRQVEWFYEMDKPVQTFVASVQTDLIK